MLNTFILYGLAGFFVILNVLTLYQMYKLNTTITKVLTKPESTKILTSSKRVIDYNS